MAQQIGVDLKRGSQGHVQRSISRSHDDRLHSEPWYKISLAWQWPLQGRPKVRSGGRGWSRQVFRGIGSESCDLPDSSNGILRHAPHMQRKLCEPEGVGQEDA